MNANTTVRLRHTVRRAENISEIKEIDASDVIVIYDTPGGEVRADLAVLLRMMINWQAHNEQATRFSPLRPIDG
jgi:hypothetical protein